jgi:hypothetical protein
MHSRNNGIRTGIIATPVHEEPGTPLSELHDLRRRIQDARESGKGPTLVLMSPANWFRLKASYADETGAPDPTFKDVLGLDVFFVDEEAPGEGPYIVVEEDARRIERGR